MKKRLFAALALALLLAISGCATQAPMNVEIEIPDGTSPAAEVTLAQTAAPTAAESPQTGETPAIGAVPTATAVPAETAAVETEAPKLTAAPTATAKITSSPKATATAAATATPKVTATPKPTTAATATPKVTATPKPTQTPAATLKPTPAPTAAPTATPRITATPTATATPAATPKPTSAPNLSYEEQVAELVNEIRAENGLGALKLNGKLSDVARAKSQDMHDLGYFAHESPTYGSPFEMMTSFGISYRAAGENIAMGYASPQSVVDAWMNSSGHRANILGGSFTEIGVGYVKDGNYWTQMFIG